MKRIAAMFVVMLGLTIGGMGIHKEGKEMLTGRAAAEAMPPKDDVNILIIGGIIITLGGAVWFFYPNKDVNQRTT